MKKILFALSALAFTLFLAFCQKAEVQETPASKDLGASVTDRGCMLDLYADNLSSVFRICGINVNNNTACNTCAATATGAEQFVGGAHFDLSSATFPLAFSVRNVSTVNGWVTLVSSGGTLAPISIPAGVCVDFVVDDQCVVQ